MKKLILILLIITFLFVGFFVKNTSKHSNTTQTAILKGSDFLNNNYNRNSGYNDLYLKYVYPDEKLYCPLEGCRITYRILDAYFGLLFIKQLDNYGALSGQIDYADGVLSSLIDLWQNEKIYNTKKSTLQDGGGIALDTYCILGYIYSDKKMAENTLRYLEGDKWLEEDYYKEDTWRNVADESWCIRLLIETNNLETKNIKSLIEKKIEETDEIILSNDDLSTKIATVIHTIYMIYDFLAIKKDYSFNNKLLEYQNYVFMSFSNNDIKNDDLILSNVLDSLAYSDYDKNKLQDMANILVSRQKMDGGWYTGEGISKNNLGVFTTIRVITALKRFEAIQS